MRISDWSSDVCSSDLFQDGIEPLVDDPHRALSEECVDAVLSECFGYVHERPARQPGRAFQVSSMRIAFSRLRRMRLNDADSDAISSLPVRSYSGPSICPLLPWLATSAMFSHGLITT